MREEFTAADFAARDAFFKEKVAHRHALWELYLYGKMKPVRDPQVVADVLQEFYLRVLKNWLQIPQDSDAAIQANLFTILRNELFNHYRRNQAKPQTDELNLANALPGEAFDPDARQMLEYVQALIRKHLSEEDQQIMQLRVVDDRSYQEIAEMMNMPIDTVSTRIHRARKMLKQKMEGP